MTTHYRGSPAQIQALGTFIKLMRAASTLSARLNGPMRRDHGLSESQLGVLEVLLHLGPMPQTRLCGKLLISGSNLTTVLDTLERRHWVRRTRDPEDRRVQVVDLTAQGRAVIRRAFPRHAENVTALLGALSRDEQQRLGALCRKLGLAAAGA